MKQVHIRFNTNFPNKSQFEWRLIIDGKQELVNAIRIETPCYTTSEFIEGEGMKYHITAKANLVEITNSAGQRIAYIK